MAVTFQILCKDCNAPVYFSGLDGWKHGDGNRIDYEKQESCGLVNQFTSAQVFDSSSTE